MTASIGLATAHDDDDLAIPDLLARADENLYAAKRGGRDRTVANGEMLLA